MRNLSLLVAALTLTAMGPMSAYAHQDGNKKGHAKDEDKNPLPPYSGPKKRLAIVELEMKAAPAADSGINTNQGTYNYATGTYSPGATATANATGDAGTGLTEMLASALQDSGRFILLERKALADITAEQQLSNGAGFDTTSAAKTGGLLGAQFLVRGAITQFGTSHNTQSGSGILNNLGITSDKSETECKLDLRIYEVATGVLLDAVTGDGKVRAQATGVNFTQGNLNLGSSASQTSPMAEAIRKALADATKKICIRLDKLPWEGHIADMDSTGSDVKVLYLGTGSEGGLKPGQHFTVLHPGRTIVDPDTKTVIGRTKDTLIGHAVLESVTAKLATLTVVDGTGFAVGDVVTWDDAPGAPAAGTTPATPTAPTNTPLADPTKSS